MPTPEPAALPAADRAYQHLKGQLLDGVHADGELLSEGEVAGALGMSRTPVREAFLRLQSEGFLRLYPKRGALVVPITPAEGLAVLEARLAMEGFALDKLRAMGPATVRAVGDALAALPACTDSTMDGAALHTADREFHATLVAAAGNPVVSQLYDALRDRQMRLTALVGRRSPGHGPRVVHQHAAIADALRADDPDQAKHLLREHLLTAAHGLGITDLPLLNPAPATLP